MITLNRSHGNNVYISGGEQRQACRLSQNFSSNNWYGHSIECLCFIIVCVFVVIAAQANSSMTEKKNFNILPGKRSSITGMKVIAVIEHFYDIL
jgi:hypothetical protein